MPGHGRRGPQRRVRRQRAGVRRRRARPDRRCRASSPSTTPASPSTCQAGTFGHGSRPSCGPTTGSPSGTGRSRSSCRRSAAGWRAARPASTRPATARSRTSSIGLDVVLADGRRITTGGPPRQAAGPDLTQLFVGSEGTLGVITGARLRARPVPPAEARAAYGFPTFAAGHGRLPAHPPPRRHAGRAAPLRRARVGAASLRAPRAPTCCSCSTRPTPRSSTPRWRSWPPSAPGAERLDDALVERWLGHRNDVSALEALTTKGFVVDTMEIAAPWSRLDAIYDAHGRRAPGGAAHAGRHRPPEPQLPRRRLPLLHASPPGRPPTSGRRPTWRSGTPARGPSSAAGGALSHHHGVGLNRARFVADALGAGLRRARPRPSRRSTRTASSTRASSAWRPRSARWRGRRGSSAPPAGARAGHDLVMIELDRPALLRGIALAARHRGAGRARRSVGQRPRRPRLARRHRRLRGAARPRASAAAVAAHRQQVGAPLDPRHPRRRRPVRDRPGDRHRAPRHQRATRSCGPASCPAPSWRWSPGPSAA